MNKLVLKFIWKGKGPRTTTKKILENKEESELSVLKLIPKQQESRLWYRHTEKHIDQGNRTKSAIFKKIIFIFIYLLDWAGS